MGVGLPFGIHGIYLLITGKGQTRRLLLTTGIIALGLASLQLVWQTIATGDPFFNLYTLWWEYDKVGFGPGYGVVEGGHSLEQAITNTRQTLEQGIPDLFGWGKLTWVFLPFGLVALVKNRTRWLDGSLIISVFPALVLIYMAYWIGAFLFGPRYYYEGFFSLTILSAAGVAWLGGWPYRPREHWERMKKYQRARSIATLALLFGLIGYNLVAYTPPRLADMHGLYDVEHKHIEPFLSAEAQKLTPALIIVHPQKFWIEYGTLLELSNPYLDTPFIFVISRGTNADEAVAEAFPERKVFHYYQDEPYNFYTAPRPED